jgi:hypothetical protein
VLGSSPLTHVGIVDVAEDGVFVIHAKPPEGSDPGGVTREPLADFADAEEATGIAVYRRTDVDADTLGRVVKTARGYAQARVPFDGTFDLQDGSAMYCTEMAVRASRAVGAPLQPRRTMIDLAGSGGSYVLPRDLLISRGATFRLMESSDGARRPADQSYRLMHAGSGSMVPLSSSSKE